MAKMQEVMQMPDSDDILASALKAQQDTLTRDFEEVMAELENPQVPRLAAGLRQDGTLHIYVDMADSGLSVGLDDDGTLWVRVDESKRAMKVTGQ